MATPQINIAIIVRMFCSASVHLKGLLSVRGTNISQPPSTIKRKSVKD
jgi:hypothetical protein